MNCLQRVSFVVFPKEVKEIIENLLHHILHVIGFEDITTILFQALQSVLSPSGV